jgi:hypothetical protein
MHHRGVLLVETVRHRHVIVFLAEREQRRRRFDGPGKVADDGDVFLIDINLHGCRQIIALDHQRPAHFKHA